MLLNTLYAISYGKYYFFYHIHHIFNIILYLPSRTYVYTVFLLACQYLIECLFLQLKQKELVLSPFSNKTSSTFFLIFCLFIF